MTALRFDSIPAYYAACGLSGTTKVTLEHLFNNICKGDKAVFDRLLADPTRLSQATFPTGGRLGERAIKIAESFRERYEGMLSLAHLWVKVPEAPTLTAAQAAPLKIDLAGKQVCMTGEWVRGRNELAAQLRAAGAIVQTSVTGKTDILIMADKESTSGKAKKARDAGTTLMNYEDVFS